MSVQVSDPNAELQSPLTIGNGAAWNPFDSRYLPDREALGKSHFQFAFLFIPSASRRQALNDLYAFCRLLDDISDAPSLSTEVRAHWLLEIRKWLHKNELIGHSYWDRWKLAITHLEIPVKSLEEIIVGVEWDLQKHPTIRTWDELTWYADHVASAVGVATLAVIGVYAQDPSRAESYAQSLGRALQYLNVMRDLEEDRTLGRDYVPSEWRKLHREDETPALRSEFFQRAEAFRKTSKPFSWRCLPVEIMADCYFTAAKKWWVHGDSRRLTTGEKIRIALTSLAHLPARLART